MNKYPNTDRQYDVLVGWDDPTGDGPMFLVQDVSVLRARGQEIPEGDQPLEFGWRGYDALFMVYRVRGGYNDVRARLSKLYDESVEYHRTTEGQFDDDYSEEDRKEELAWHRKYAEMMVEMKEEALNGMFGDYTFTMWMNLPEGERCCWETQSGHDWCPYVKPWRDPNKPWRL